MSIESLCTGAFLVGADLGQRSIGDEPGPSTPCLILLPSTRAQTRAAVPALSAAVEAILRVHPDGIAGRERWVGPLPRGRRPGSLLRTHRTPARRPRPRMPRPRADHCPDPRLAPVGRPRRSPDHLPHEGSEVRWQTCGGVCHRPGIEAAERPADDRNRARIHAVLCGKPIERGCERHPVTSDSDHPNQFLQPAEVGGVAVWKSR